MMAAITSTAHTKINSVIFVESLADDEMHTGTWVHEDLAAYLDCLPIHHEFHTVRDRIGLFLLLNQLRDRARDQHLRPIIHIDAHGSEDKTGVRVLPSGDVVPWADLAGLFRNINRETLNNLVVVMSMCYGFRGIVPVGIDKLTPFCQLVGPEMKVKNRAIQAAFPRFYRTLFDQGDFVAAGNSIVGLGFRTFYAEKVLTRGFLEYLILGCRGRGRQERMERILSDVRAARPDRTAAEIRSDLRELVKLENQDIERYKRRFLMSDHPENAGRFTISLDDCLEYVNDVEADDIAALRVRRGLG